MRGIRVAQEGFRTTDADNRQAYSSSWPVFNIIAEGPFLGTQRTVVYEHNLGYVPMFFAVTGATNPATGSRIAGTRAFTGSLEANEKVIRIPSSVTVDEGYFYIFNIDLNQPLTTPSISLGTSKDAGSFADSDRGVKFSDPEHTLNDTNLKDYNVRSDVSQLLIHSVNPGIKHPININPPVIFEHRLGYIPKAFLYSTLSSQFNDYYGFSLSSSSAGLISKTNTVEMYLPGNGEKYSVVIMKDFLVPQ